MEGTNCRDKVLAQALTNNTVAAGTAAPSGSTRGRRPPRRPKGSQVGIRLVEGAYVMLLGFLATKLIYILLTPLASPETLPSGRGPGPAPVDLTLLSRFDPFVGVVKPTQKPTYVAAQETKLDLKLVGVTYVDEDGRATATIEKSGGDQRPYFIGDAVVNGVTIRDILPEQVILSRNGIAETLSLEGRDPQAAGARTPVRAPTDDRPGIRTAASSGAGGNAPGAFDNITQFVQLRPAAGGLALYPGSQPDAFRQAGLRDGDILVAVNGQPVASLLTQNPAGLAERLMSGPTRVTVERGGNPVELSIDPTRIVQ